MKSMVTFVKLGIRKQRVHVRNVTDKILSSPISFDFRNLNIVDPSIMQTIKVENMIPNGISLLGCETRSISGDQRKTKVYIALSKQHCIIPTIKTRLSC
jgi:hypothetical protein